MGMIEGFLRVGKFGKYFLGIQNNLKIRGSAHIIRPHSAAIKVQPNLFFFLEFLRLVNLLWDLFGVKFVVQGFIFFDFLSPFDHSHNLKSKYPPPSREALSLLSDSYSIQQ